MNVFQAHTSATASRLTAHMAIQILTTELRAADAIIQALHRLIPEGAKTLRTKERTAVITMAGDFPSPAPSLLTSQDLIRRLRTLAGQSGHRASGLDSEAADHIEKLEAWIALHLPPANYSPHASAA